MINGDVNEFVDGLYYGDERWFRFNGIKYFIEGWVKEGLFSLLLYQMELDPGYVWEKTEPVTQRQEVVDAFLTDKIFDGKTFWEVEKDITWIEEWE